MIMTYAAQVRSVSKSVPPQHVDDDFYDIYSLRIICKYFVGSIVTVKTAEEIIEGVLHTISHNKICMTLVTTAKLDTPDFITETSSNKLINLNDVLIISTNDESIQEVTVKGKFIKFNNEIEKSFINKSKPNHKSEVKVKTNGKVNNKKIDKTNESEIVNGNGPVIDESLNIESKDSELTSSKTENKVEAEEFEKPKKTFAFNPNAPEFKPRINVKYSDNINGHIMYSPRSQQFPPVFTPSSAPAIFVPNIFFYAPSANQQLNNIETRSFDSNNNSSSDNNSEVPINKSLNADDQFVRKPIPDVHLPNSAMSFPPMLPIFSPPLPIFVPNHSFKFNTLPYNNIEICNDNDVKDSKEVVENNELSNPSNWPPLPVPINQATAKSTHN